MDFKIAVIKGDGVGPEIVDEGLKVLDKIRERIVREWKEEDELDRVGYMNFYMGMKYAIEFILNESEFYEY